MNRKRVHRIMQQNALLLERHNGRREVHLVGVNGFVASPIPAHLIPQIDRRCDTRNRSSGFGSDKSDHEICVMARDREWHSGKNGENVDYRKSTFPGHTIGGASGAR